MIKNVRSMTNASLFGDVEKLEAELYGPRFSSASSGVSLSSARFQELLAEQLQASQKALGDSHEQVLDLVKKHLEKVNQADAEVVELRVENEMLRHECGHGCPPLPPDSEGAQVEAAVTEEAGKEISPKHPGTEKPQGFLSGPRKDRGVRGILSAGAPRPTGLAGVEPGAFDAKHDTHSRVSFELPSGEIDKTEEPPFAAWQSSSKATGEVESSVVIADTHQDGNVTADNSERKNAMTGLQSQQSYSRISESSNGDVLSSLASGEFGFRSSMRSSADAAYAKTLQEVSMQPIHSSQVETHQFELLKCWGTEERSRRNGINVPYGRIMLDDYEEEPIQDEVARPSRNSAEQVANCRLLIHPHSLVRAMWNCSEMSAVLYDMVTIPLQMFDPDENWFSIAFGWITRLFWTTDIYVSFVSGFLTREGDVVMDPRTIVRRYLTTWFILDLLIVGVDWLELVYSSSSGMHGYARLGKASRAFRIIRMVRLLRLLRMKEVFELAIERLRSERLMVVANICKLVTVLLGFSHLIACLWYGIGVRGGVDTAWVDEGNFPEREFGYRYSTSLHWALSQLTGGMDEVRPTNSGERVYSCFVFVLGFIMAAIFVSSLTSSMTQLHLLSGRQTEQLCVLRRFLLENRIPNKLAMRIQRNAQHALAERQRNIPDTSIELLRLVSEPLRIDLHFAMYSPHFAGHVFFERYVAECPQVMRKVCHKAMKISLVSPGDVLFHAGEISTEPRMYIVTSGELRYLGFDGRETHVTDGTTVSEAALWVHWMHRGMLRAQSKCFLSTLDSNQFQAVVSQFDHQELNPRTYATQFVEDLNQLEDPTDLTDGMMIWKLRSTNHQRRTAKRLFPFQRQLSRNMDSAVSTTGRVSHQAKVTTRSSLDNPRHGGVKSAVKKMLGSSDSIETTPVTPIEGSSLRSSE